MDEDLLSRVEDAGLNASAPPQQRWLDGWLVRYSPGKARRARCINALASGRLPLAHKLSQCQALYREAGLPMVFRITRFAQPPGLDGQLAALGMDQLDDTRVMVCTELPPDGRPPLPAGLACERLDGAAFADSVGALRGSSPDQRTAHAQRLAASPVPYQGSVLRRSDDGTIVACGQVAIEADLAGVYDVHTRDDCRGQGLATRLCQHLLASAARQGVKVAYLQVEGDNAPARRIYHRLGFADGYGYHYRQFAAG